MLPALEVIQPGPLTTVQDLGRPHAMAYGVPAGGAMDSFALQAANRLVGNSPDAAVLEITAGQASFVALSTLLAAITGADFQPRLDDRPAPMWSSFLLRAGAQLTFGVRRFNWGARAYLALRGGIDVPIVLGSRSTDLAGGFGGLAGRSVQPADLIGVFGAGACDRSLHCIWREDMRPPYGTQPVLRMVRGPHLDFFEPASRDSLVNDIWRVGVQSNRIGYRLEGPAPIRAALTTIPSFGVVMGALQVPPDGRPILLMADAQTTGGYPIVGVVVRADLSLAAQLLPGDTVRFRFVTQEEAIAAWQRTRDWLARGLIEQDDEPTEAALRWAGALE
ncbi:MAG: biotin-dependent carboxyltransferase family protein [Anaerolineae bacterium]|nr:biotin-dependent carboxyltransferase family protein [Thermoflexales bacterium]MDW8406865.1 biotin-dependent carboxyltransferase family protein [Anaerolineae bacterium]